MAPQAPDLAAEDGQPTFSDLQGGNIYAVTANKHWLKPDTQIRFSSKVVKEIYSALEQDGFPQRDLLLLENLQYMERCVRETLPPWGMPSILNNGQFFWIPERIALWKPIRTPDEPLRSQTPFPQTT